MLPGRRELDDMPGDNVGSIEDTNFDLRWARFVESRQVGTRHDQGIGAGTDESLGDLFDER
jgi:hypothetical protein